MTQMPAFRVGAYFPHTEIRPDSIEIRDFAQAVEQMGFTHIACADHVVGANRASRPDWKGPYDSTSKMYDPLTLFSYLAGATTKLGFVTAVIIGPQRQTVLIAKQASNLDLFCGGRLRVGLGTGWNQVEYEALAMSWPDRGARLDEQIRVLRRLWSEEHVTERGKYHRITDAGLAPMPVQRPIPIWIGGESRVARLRAAQLGDGWLPYLTTEGAEEKLAGHYDAVRAAGRNPADVPVENIVHLGTAGGGPIREIDDVIADIEIWKRLGIYGVCVYTMNRGLDTLAKHLKAFQQVSDAFHLTATPKKPSP